MAEVKVEGYAYDQQTRDWTKRVEYVARDRMEAIRWMAFNRDWFKRLRILPSEAAADLCGRQDAACAGETGR